MACEKCWGDDFPGCDNCREVSESTEAPCYAKLFTVHAYRWGDRSNHSYPVGVFTTIGEAKAAKVDEEYERGGKYECEIYEWRANRGRNRDFKTISPLDSGIVA